MKCTCKQ